MASAPRKPGEPVVDVLVLAVPVGKPEEIDTPEVRALFAGLAGHAEHAYVCVHTNHAGDRVTGGDRTDEDRPNVHDIFGISAQQVLTAEGPFERFNFYWHASQALQDRHDSLSGDIVLCDTSLIGPLQPLEPLLQARAEDGVDLMSAFCTLTDADSEFSHFKGLGSICETSWLHMSAELWHAGILQTIFRTHRDRMQGNHLLKAEAEISKALAGSQEWKRGSYDRRAEPESSSPHLLEADRLVEAGHPFLHRLFLLLGPLVFEMQTIYGRRTLDAVRDHSGYDVDIIWDVILRTNRLRDIVTKFEELIIIDDRTPPPGAISGQTRCALVAHAYYPDFITEVFGMLRCMPENTVLMVSVSSAEDRDAVEEIIRREGVVGATVRIVEVNRGRDMSSLFISFREDFIDCDIDVALRIHSKKTPQLPQHISETFREHLFDNLINSKAYVETVVKLFEDEPKIGMAFPPIIHVGFATLGHSWFVNRPGADAMAERLGIDVELDDDTPVAPYGTMFWFRPDALAPMFHEHWQWDEFNPEPNHVDGSLAHIMERLMGYVAQSRGYRSVQIINRTLAARGYVKLEYKLQRLAGCFPTGDIRAQVRLASAIFGKTGSITERLSQGWVARRSRIHRDIMTVWQAIKGVVKTR